MSCLQALERLKRQKSSTAVTTAAGYGDTCLANHAPLHAQGYGTILFAEESDAENAINQHNGTDLEGRTLSVKYDQYAS